MTFTGPVPIPHIDCVGPDGTRESAAGESNRIAAA
jgi:hypothetical protein